jgi:tellurite resistance protein TerC
MSWPRKALDFLRLKHSPIARKIVVGVIGGTIVLVGIILIVMPGPAFVVIPIGLVILASEFAWARHVLRRGKRAAKNARHGKWREAFESVHKG